MTPAEIVYPDDAPFTALVIPRGMARVLTAPEVVACNLKYPVPPNGFQYWMPKSVAP